MNSVVLPAIRNANDERRLVLHAAPAFHSDEARNAALTECWAWGGWEPQRHYRRRGQSSTVYFGDGEWLEAWQDRVDSDECLEMLADLGVTTVITRFYKGFGRALESQEWPALRSYVERCHRLGMKVWGYMQGQSIYPETLFLERPDAKDWLALTYEGKPDTWSGSYYRNAPCLTSDGYLEYMQDIAREGVADIGLDGIHLDNSYYRHCYCPRCRELFRGWLDSRGDLELRTGLPSARAVNPPPLPGQVPFISDPLQILWMEFGMSRRSRFMKALAKVAKDENPCAVLSQNPAFPKRLASGVLLGLDPAGEGEFSDFICAENGNQPRADEGGIFSQTLSYLFASAGHYRAFSSTWRSGRFGSSPPPDAGAVWAGLAEEFSYGASAMMGNNWLLRPSGDGDRLLADEESELVDAFTEGLNFFRSVQSEFIDDERKPWSEVALLVNTRSFSLAPGWSIAPFLVLTQMLIAHRIAFRLVHAGQAIPAEVRDIVVCEQVCLSDAELGVLEDFVEQRDDVTVWLTEGVGRYDEWFVPRNRSRYESLRRKEGFRLIEGRPNEWCRMQYAAQHFGAEQAGITPQGEAVLGSLIGALLGRQEVTIQADAPVLMNLESTKHGDLLIHLRDQGGSGRPVEGLRLSVGERLGWSAHSMAWWDGRAFRVGDVAGQSEMPDFTFYAVVRVRKTKQGKGNA